jgi:hypothetical protein
LAISLSYTTPLAAAAHAVCPPRAPTPQPASERFWFSAVREERHAEVVSECSRGKLGRADATTHGARAIGTWAFISLARRFEKTA